MSATRYASVLDLGFGDCGKGLFIDVLTRRWQAHTVVRFSGGAQAGHNVVDSSSGRHHTFSQFGAGTFVEGTCTVLLSPMIVHPTALLVEAEALAKNGIHDALQRLSIDAQCRITTPFHQAAGRLREGLRGLAHHGTCGVGVGETVRHGLEHPDQQVLYAELAGSHSQRQQLIEKLQAIRQTLLRELQPLCSDQPLNAALQSELSLLQDENIAARWLSIAQALTRQCPPANTETLGSILHQPGCVLFEGAQGILLDEWRGFHPHTTWSSITTQALESALTRFDIATPIEHNGVLRTYLTRHGTGPLPTEDAELDQHLPEPHNQSAGWQGAFRRGHPDAVLLRYALEAVGKLQGLLISHMDIFQQQAVPLRWCEAYAMPSHAPMAPVTHLPLGPLGDLAHQEKLTHLLTQVKPLWSASSPIKTSDQFLQHLSSVTDLPVILQSHGNTSDHVRS